MAETIAVVVPREDIIAAMNAIAAARAAAREAQKRAEAAAAQVEAENG